MACAAWSLQAEAARRLGVKPATLYAYVSRGLLSRERAPDGRRPWAEPNAEAGLLGTPGTGWDVGHAAAFLASPLASGITGATIYVDKGYHAMGKGGARPERSQ